MLPNITKYGLRIEIRPPEKHKLILELLNDVLKPA
jgi:hypothetical protein